MADKKTHYFVIMAWENDKGEIVFDQDHSTQEARFPEGTTWNDETEEWENDYKASDKAYEALVNALNDQDLWDGIV